MSAGTLPGALERASLQTLLDGDPPLVAGMPDPAAQLQPNGIDLTLRSAAWLASPGRVGAAAQDRLLAGATLLDFDHEGWVHLAPGPYLITLNEVVHLPAQLMALARPRSSLLRCGVTVHTAVWDAGYEGRSQCLLNVINPHGFQTQRDARLVQLVFFTLAQPVEQGYQGVFQRENL
jgi:dUTP pyrophosphatase